MFECCNIFAPVCIQVQRVQPQRRKQVWVSITQPRQPGPVFGIDTGHNHAPHAMLPRSLEHLLSVGIERLHVDMAMGIDQIHDSSVFDQPHVVV